MSYIQVALYATRPGSSGYQYTSVILKERRLPAWYNAGGNRLNRFTDGILPVPLGGGGL